MNLCNKCHSSKILNANDLNFSIKMHRLTDWSRENTYGEGGQRSEWHWVYVEKQ